MENLAVDNREVIIKSNNLIDCSYKLTLAEQRILNIACKRLKPMFVDKNISMNEFKMLSETMAFEPIEISVYDYVKEYNIKSKSIYKELSKIATSLYEKEIIYFDEDDNLTRKRWVITCKYKDKEGKISLKFHPDLITDLLVFKGSYTQLNTAFLNGVKSFYASRLYELLRQYLVIGVRKFELEDLRFKLGLSDTEYPRFSNFKQKILKPSVEWINSNSDIAIDVTEDKCGTRSVKKIEFKIKEQHKQGVGYEDITSQMFFEFNEEKSAYKKIKNIVCLDLTAEQAEKICDAAIIGLKNHGMEDIKGLDYIKEKWGVVKEYGKYKKEGDFNPIGSLISALKYNWVNSKEVGFNQKIIKQLKFDNFEGRTIVDEKAYEEMLLGYREYDPKIVYGYES